MDVREQETRKKKPKARI